MTRPLSPLDAIEVSCWAAEKIKHDELHISEKGGWFQWTCPYEAIPIQEGASASRAEAIIDAYLACNKGAKIGDLPRN